jgi:hypothetical protein
MILRLPGEEIGTAEPKKMRKRMTAFSFLILLFLISYLLPLVQ